MTSGVPSVVRWPSATLPTWLDRPEPPVTALPGVIRIHLDELTGRLGIYQHARGREPDPAHGYCTDDVARAAIVDVLHGRQLGFEAVETSLQVSLAFVAAAFVARTGRLRNFRDDAGRWLEPMGSPDSHARGVQALGVISGEPLPAALRERARHLLDLTLPAAVDLDGLRPAAHVVLGCLAALRGGQPPASAQLILEELAGRIMIAFRASDDEWPWPEPVATYENALLPQALIEAGDWLGDRAMVEQGLASLDWLLAAQLAPMGYFELVGNVGWWPRGDVPARFDQQPIDAAALVDALAAAWRVTGERAWLIELDRAYAWFSGWNSVGIPVAEPDRGGCGDGLSAVGVNANQGAESTLAWLAATEAVRLIRSPFSPRHRPPRAAG